LTASYAEAIKPSRWSLPVADRLYDDQVVLGHWTIFGCDPERPRLLTDAIDKLYRNRHDLVRVSEGEYV